MLHKNIQSSYNAPLKIFNPHMLHKSPVVDLTTSFQHVEVEPIVESSNLGIIKIVDNN